MGSFFYYEDYDTIDEDARNLYRQGMAAFEDIAPTYHIALPEKPLRLCRQCQKVFVASRSVLPFAAHGAKISIMSIRAGQRMGEI